MITNIDKEHKLESYLNENKITVLKFSTLTCGPCRMLKPIYEKVAEETESDYATFLAVNATENLPLMQEFKIRAVPTVVFMRGTEVLEKCNGFLTEGRLRGIIDGHISNL